MSVKSVHPEYLKALDDWQKCRDVFEGSSTVKAAAKRYLPELSEQTKDEYKAYVDRALFYSILSKSVSAMIGIATAKPSMIVRPEIESDYLFTEHNGYQYDEVYVSILEELLVMGRIGILCDRPIGGQARPIIYPAESIINWVVDGESTQMVVLKETIMVTDKDDKFNITEETQYRELGIDSEGFYYQQIYNTSEEMVGLPIYPTNSGIKMRMIPFFVASAKGLGFYISKSPSIDLAEVNLSHYRSSADLEHGRHYTALPTPVITGADASTVLRIGSATAWCIPSEKASAKYLEFTGQGLRSLEKALEEKEAQLAKLSARLIDNSGNGSEAVEAVRLRYASEGANLASVLRSCEALQNIVYFTLMQMERIEGDMSIKHNKEFFTARMSYVELEKLVSSYIQGVISKETLVYNLRRGEIISPENDGTDEGKLPEK